jgi:hypothetical protein
MESGAICYMMSKQGYGGDSIRHRPFPPDVLLLADRPRNLGSESAGFSRLCGGGPSGATDLVGDYGTTLIRRNGITSFIARIHVHQ